MARPRAADHEDKRQAILAAAAELFARTGFDRASMAEVAKACGVSKALLYHYYASKEALLFDILKLHLTRLLETVRAEDDPALPPSLRLERLVSALLFAYRDADAMHNVQINELAKLPPTAQSELKELQRAIVAIVADALAAGSPGLAADRDRLLKPVTMTLFGALNWSYLWFRDGGPISRHELARLVTRLVMAGARELGKGLPQVAS
jgi:TetR/AcrR family transcriptional regulator